MGAVLGAALVPIGSVNSWWWNHVATHAGDFHEEVGWPELVETVATLVEPPASPLGEPEWTGGIVAASGAPMLLDLHNLYANAVNFGDEPHAYLRRFPLDRVAAVHLAGGRWIEGPNGARRLLDDHESHTGVRGDALQRPLILCKHAEIRPDIGEIRGRRRVVAHLRRHAVQECLRLVGVP